MKSLHFSCPSLTASSSTSLELIASRTCAILSSRLLLFLLACVCFTVSPSSSAASALETTSEQTRPVFVLALNVCNGAGRLLYELQAVGSNLSYTLDSDVDNIVLQGSKLYNVAPFDEQSKEIRIGVHSNVTREANEIRLRFNISESFCASTTASMYCTIVIVFLASLSLVLLMALAVVLIVLRRKKPIVFANSSYKTRKERGSDGLASLGTSSLREENDASPGKASSGEPTVERLWCSGGPEAASAPNGNNNISTYSPNLGSAAPRKSSLKATKLFADKDAEAGDGEQGERSAAYCNGAFDSGGVDDKSDRMSRSGSSDDSGDGRDSPKPLSADEPRRKSVVTFANTAQVIQITTSSGSK